ncbi:hypothetical protein BC831DRAFT_2950 [Entophlyctis helioformis]|nr:hypothetical protein BC831DRAFT_2950 [Entophlyctis helioformis]
MPELQRRTPSTRSSAHTCTTRPTNSRLIPRPMRQGWRCRWDQVRLVSRLQPDRRQSQYSLRLRSHRICQSRFCSTISTKCSSDSNGRSCQQQQQQQQQLAGQQQQPPQPEQSDVCSQPSQQPSAPASRHLVQLHHRQPPTVSDARSTLQTSLAAGTGTTGVSTTVSIGSVVQALGSATPMEGPTRLGMAQHMPSTQQAVAVTAFNPDCNHIVTKQAPPAASDRQTSTLPAWLALPALPPLPNTPTTNVQPSTQHLQPPSAEHLNSTALDTAATGSSTNLTADHPPAIEIKWAPADARKKVEDHYVQAARDSNHVREQLERQKLFAACYNTPPAARLQKQLHKPSVQLDTPPQQPAQKSAHRHMQASSAKYAIQAHAKPGIVTLAQAPSAPSAAIGHTETSFVTTATITAVPSLPTYDESSMHTAETRPQPLAHTSRHCDAPPALNLDNEPLAAMAATAAAVSRAEQFADTSTMLTEGMAGPALLAEHAIKSRATATLLASTGTISAAAHPGPSAPSTVHHTSHLAPPLLSNAHRHYLAAPSASSHVQDSKRQPQEGLHAHFETQPLPQQHQQYQQYQQHQPPPFPNGYSHQAPPSHCSSHSSHRSMGPPINYIPATVLRDGFDGKEQPSTLGPRVCSLAGHFSLTTHAVPSGGGPSTNESDRIEAYLAFPPPPTSSILCKPLHTGIMRRQEVINRYFLRAPPSYESLEDFPPRQPQVGSGHVGLAATTAAPAAALSSRIIPAAAHASMGQGPQQGLLLEARERAQVASPASNGHEQHQQHKEHRQSPETAGTGVGASMRQTNRRAGMSTMSPIQEDDMVGDLDNVSDISEQFIDRRPPRRASDSFYHAGSLGSLFAFSLSMLPSYHSVDSRRSHWKVRATQNAALFVCWASLFYTI